LKVRCPKCGNETDALVTNTEDNSEGCWPCVAGPDNFMLRMVAFQMEAGNIEVHTVWADNNKKAMQQFWKRGVKSMQCVPLYN
jgi:hypothetical protein